MGGYINTTPIVFFRSVSIYYSPKWKMIGPAAKAYIVNLELYQRRDLKRHILLTFGIGKIIFLFEMFSHFQKRVNLCCLYYNNIKAIFLFVKLRWS